jgi:ribonuclease HII
LLVRIWDKSVQEFGVDEAGKGPVLGPMVAACVVGDPAALPAVDDSKALSAARRETLAGQLRDDSGVQISVARVPTERIDDPTTDMNTLTVAAHAETLEQVASGLSGVVDACDTNADRFARRVEEKVDTSLEIHAEHAADETYPLVSAASVIAKVERDKAIDALQREYGDVGSGYPSDPTTRAFLEEYVEEHGQLPACARTSWKTSKDVIAAVEQSSLDSF